MEEIKDENVLIESQDQITISDEIIEELKQEILEKEQEVLHLKKHGMKDTIISMIKARIK